MCGVAVYWIRFPNSAKHGSADCGYSYANIFGFFQVKIGMKKFNTVI